MKRIVFFCTALLTITVLLNAQSISPQVIATTGEHFADSNFQVSWTLGEPLTTTISNGNIVLTQGFHQTFITVTSVKENIASTIDILVYPNPTSAAVNISLANNSEDLQIEFFDMSGKLVFKDKIAANQSHYHINMSEYAASNYILHLFSLKDGNGNNYKIEKVN
jgi:hypothetical protein